MQTLIIGASGATGKLLVEQLLGSGNKVKIIIRPTSNIPDNWSGSENLTIIKKNISELKINDIADYLTDCNAVVSCLGHNLTLKGIYGEPRNLVAGSVQLFCEAIFKESPLKPLKFILMNTAGNSNRDLNEPVSFGQRIVIALLRLLLPPHVDNEKASDYLREKVGQKNPYIEWVVVRPDSLINEEKVSAYTLYNSPTRSAIFNPGKTSRINVGHFMSRLILVDEIWNKWKGQMPVIYNDIEND